MDDKKKQKGKVVLTFDIERMGESQQIMVTHDIKLDQPTTKGRKSENNKTETPMHVDINGNISLFPANQHEMFSRNGEVKA